MGEKWEKNDYDLVLFICAAFREMGNLLMLQLLLHSSCLDGLFFFFRLQEANLYRIHVPTCSYSLAPNLVASCHGGPHSWRAWKWPAANDFVFLQCAHSFLIFFHYI